MEFDLDVRSRSQITEALENYMAKHFATNPKGCERLDAFLDYLEHCATVGTTLHVNPSR